VRAYLPAYEMRTAVGLEEALRLMASDPGIWRPFAGGTDLMVLLESGVLPRGRYLNIWGLGELRGIDVTDDGVAIGALTTYTAIRKDRTLQQEFPLLCRAAAETGSVAIQNRGTIGGNIANASPAADTPPALLVYGAELELVSLRGSRRVPYQRFHQGYKRMDLAPDELIARVHLRRGEAGWRHYYRKVGTRRAQAISKVCFAGIIDPADGATVRDVRIAIASVAPVPLRCERTEVSLRGRALDPAAIAGAQATLLEEIAPIDDFRSTAAYRRRVSLNLLDEFLRTAASASS
jgi:CO/xanthine dehydrogenase FAD-binding subunit